MVDRLLEACLDHAAPSMRTAAMIALAERGGDPIELAAVRAGSAGAPPPPKAAADAIDEPRRVSMSARLCAKLRPTKLRSAKVDTTKPKVGAAPGPPAFGSAPAAQPASK